MVICKKCGKETRVVCLCGHCPECNGTSRIMNEELKRIIEREKEKLKEKENHYKKGKLALKRLRGRLG